MERRVFRNYYKGHMDNNRGGVETGGRWRRVRGKGRTLYLNNNKILKKEKKYFLIEFKW